MNNKTYDLFTAILTQCRDYESLRNANAGF
jgi:hypothetical protein